MLLLRKLVILEFINYSIFVDLINLINFIIFLTFYYLNHN